jgi:hypothetical protein
MMLLQLDTNPTGYNQHHSKMLLKALQKEHARGAMLW